METESRIYSVSEITRDIKSLIEDSFPTIWVEGEVSNYKAHYSGHYYFTLKDNDAQLSCVMWRSRAASLNFDLKDGDHLQALGNLRLWEKSGRYQLDCILLQPRGKGQLQALFEQLKQKLFDEGLFDESVKQTIPKYPQTIGIITSPTGAAVRDMISVAQRRNPGCQLIVRGVKVQGAGAAEEIAQAIRDFNTFGKVDVLIVGRGGGSLEDLWAFNEEIVARAIFDSKIPVVSAVGHEIDFTISDFVADLRAPTPSAAAELIVPDAAELKRGLSAINNRLIQDMQKYLNMQRERLEALRQNYGYRRPADQVAQWNIKLDDLAVKLAQQSQRQLNLKRDKLSAIQKQLGALDPTQVLRRGYALIMKDKQPVVSIQQIQVEDEVRLKFKDGEAQSTITDIHHE